MLQPQKALSKYFWWPERGGVTLGQRRLGGSPGKESTDGASFAFSFDWHYHNKETQAFGFKLEPDMCRMLGWGLALATAAGMLQ